MRLRVGAILSALAVLVASVTAAVAVTVNDDGGWFHHRQGMMSPAGADRGDSRGGDGQGPEWGQHGWMMSGPMHGQTVGSEYDFLAEMVAHHEEAVAAAGELARSQRAEMRAFGEAIVVSQSAQIELMEQWLADWYPDRSGRVDYEPMMRDLTGLSGDTLDQAFLEDMIGHHMGAVMMSQQLLMRGLAEHDQVETLAESIRAEQHAEILQMQQWLSDWFGIGWGQGIHSGSEARG